MEQDAGLEMGKRPSRQRRHLPTAVTSAASKRSNTKQNIALLKMSFRESSKDNKEEDVGTTTGYDTPINSSINRRITTKTKYGYNNNDLKKRTKEFIDTNNSKKKKKVIIWIIIILWILFIFYRILSIFKNDNFDFLSLTHFFSIVNN